ncbi:hypothetical protein L484_017120 [Morus notabilis]|uniref:Uncharacterized protein n=1 Tax=Morus notabilis TaxID=981085 RepID=W9SC78_9ROSA|nr:hypothetical protein L484_017120 [Morus notabilis]
MVDGSSGAQAVFSALDNAKTQLYHFKAIVIAGMGFFTDAYDLAHRPPLLPKPDQKRPRYTI